MRMDTVIFRTIDERLRLALLTGLLSEFSLSDLHWRKDRRPATLPRVQNFTSGLLWILGREGLTSFHLLSPLPSLSSSPKIWSLKEIASFKK